jgi:hypothetical protein
MKNPSDFMGMQPFIWWTGIVEDRNDPLQIGRCRVRIIGWHTKDKAEIPTDALPWAHPVFPLNEAPQINPPREGSWVFGFFKDGVNGQEPVMLGLIPHVATGATGGYE